MGHQDHMREAREHVPCAVLTVSDSRTEETDRSGRLIIEHLESAGHSVEEYRVVPDSYQGIQEALRDLQGGEVKVVILTGGTGITRRDVTPEAVGPMLDKELVGFGELFRHLSYREIGPAAMMSRAMGGVSMGKIILCLPGSTGAIRLAMEEIIVPQIGHLVLEVEK